MSLGMSFARRRMMAVPGGDAIDPILNNNSWKVISQVSTAGEASNWWSVGDRKAIVLNGTVGNLSLSNYTVYAFIIGFDHNASLEGSGRIHFQLGKTELSGGKDIALCDSANSKSISEPGYFSMNSSNTNSGGWAASQMRTNICGTSLSSYSGTIIAVIPAELRDVLKSVTKYTNNTGNSSEASAVTATTDYFFLLSEYEIFGQVNLSNPNEPSKQKRYAYYSDGNGTKKYKHSATGSVTVWWIRSPVCSTSTDFRSVNTSGNASFGGANWSRGFAPAFCV